MPRWSSKHVCTRISLYLSIYLKLIIWNKNKINQNTKQQTKHLCLSSPSLLLKNKMNNELFFSSPPFLSPPRSSSRDETSPPRPNRPNVSDPTWLTPRPDPTNPRNGPIVAFLPTQPHHLAGMTGCDKCWLSETQPSICPTSPNWGLFPPFFLILGLESWLGTCKAFSWGLFPDLVVHNYFDLNPLATITSGFFHFHKGRDNESEKAGWHIIVVDLVQGDFEPIESTLRWFRSQCKVIVTPLTTALQ